MLIIKAIGPDMVREKVFLVVYLIQVVPAMAVMAVTGQIL